MKKLYLVISILATFAIITIAFENIPAKTRYFLLLFSSVDGIGAFFVILIIALLGAITGFFYAMSLNAFLGSRSDDGGF